MKIGLSVPEAESGKNFFGSLLDSEQRKQPGSSILRPVPVVPIVQWFGRLTMTGSIFRSS